MVTLTQKTQRGSRGRIRLLEYDSLRPGLQSCDRHVCRVTTAVVFRGFGRQGGVHCHKVRGTKPGEEAAGGVVMAVREAGFNPFPFALSKYDV